MAAARMNPSPAVNVFVDAANKLHWDPALTIPVTEVLYQPQGSAALYLDEALTIPLNINKITCTDAGSGRIPAPTTTSLLSSATPIFDTEMSPSTTGSTAVVSHPLPPHHVFTREQTLFLIDLMREHLTSSDADLPKSLAELGARVRMARGQKRLFWMEIAQKLTEQFHFQFDQAKVARKWGTLEDAFKKIKDNNKSTGRGVVKFEFYDEMEALIGGKHDVDFPVIGTSRGVEIKKPEALVRDTSRPSSPWLTELSPHHSSNTTSMQSPLSSEPSACSGSSSSSTISPPSRHRKKKHVRQPDQVVEFLRESEEATQRRHEEIMQQMAESQKSFESILHAFLDKQ